jgi:hypothetical protein
LLGFDLLLGIDLVSTGSTYSIILQPTSGLLNGLAESRLTLLRKINNVNKLERH